jgi:hypothetical protein
MSLPENPFKRWNPPKLWKPGWRLPFNPLSLFDRNHPVMRRFAIGSAALVAVSMIGCGALWWRLSSGPIMLDLATPWLISAIEENFGNRYRVQVGGTQLERDAQGHTAIRLRDIVVRDASGATVAMAPKAEVGIAGTSLLLARPRAASLRLVDSNMLIRVETDGRVNLFAGGDRPFASIAPDGAAAQGPAGPAGFSLRALAERSPAANMLALLAWVDGLGVETETTGGFDGKVLTEVGINNGSVAIDDRRTGQEWNLKSISLKLIRPKHGGVAFAVGSEAVERPWVMQASLTPGRSGNRLLQFDARKVLLDDLLALRMAEGGIRSDTRVSASIQADLLPDGTPQTLAGSIVAEGGSIGDPNDPDDRSIPIGSAEFGLDWDNARRSLRVPFKIQSGQARTTLRAEFAAPREAGGNWQFAVGGGWVLLDPLSPDDEGMALKRVVLRGQIDPNKQRVALDLGDVGTRELGGTADVHDITLALSGYVDYSGTDPRLAIGMAGNRMNVAALKRVWPSFVAPPVREWVIKHLVTGQVERLDVAINTPWSALTPAGPWMADDALSIDIVTSGTTLRPVEGLPLIRDANLTARITGQTATVTLGKGNVDVSAGRRLALSNVVFEVPDMRIPVPPAKVRFKVEGPIPAAAELLALERLRDFSGTPFDPATTRGTLSGQVNLGIPLRANLGRGSTTYGVAVDLTNFSADKLMMGHKVEGQSLRLTADNQGFQMRGDVRINGTPALIEYRKASNEPDSELKLATTLDEAARVKLGMDFGTAVTGGIPIRMAARIAPTERDNRFNVEADLTPVKIDQLLPGWIKPPGKPARMTFIMSRDKGLTRFDDLLIDGQGVLAKGSIEADANGELQSANFPVFATSDGDKATIKADRGQDGMLRVVMRGDVFDGRSFVKTTMSGPTDPKAKPKQPDIDLDIKVGVVAGHHGEALRALEMKMTRRGGRIRNFTMNAKIGRDTPLIGEMRTRVSNSKQILYFETNDAGALFRFTDMYPRMVGGKIWVVMDPPTQEMTPQDGLINVRDFTIRDEAALDRVVANNQQNGPRAAIEFSQARAEFTKTPGRMAVREGLVRGPMIGGTIEGNIDYARDQVNMRGTLVPLYGINNMFGQIPIVGLFLGGGSNEGLLGITYEVTGPIGNPRPLVNPLSAIAPGLLRKFFEFRDNSTTERAFTDPSR